MRGVAAQEMEMLGRVRRGVCECETGVAVGDGAYGKTCGWRKRRGLSVKKVVQAYQKCM